MEPRLRGERVREDGERHQRQGYRFRQVRAPLSEPGGEWNGKQVVPASWVEESTRLDTSTDPADFYQYFWWVDVVHPERGRFMARGNLGQFIYVVPDKELVIVRMGESFGYNRWPELLRSIADKAPS